MKAMLFSKLKAAIAVVLILGFLATGTTVLICRTAAGDGPAPLAGAGGPATPARGALAKTQQESQKQEEKGREKERFTAWGEEVGGLQAGFFGEKRAYSHGETVRLGVRVRNVTKKEVKFQFLREFFIEKPPAVTNGDGKPVRLEGSDAGGLAHVPVEAKLAPGEEVELYELKLKLRPASERGKEEYETLYGTGKFQIQYERILGNSSAGKLTPDPNLEKLATGKLELEVKPALPPASEIKGNEADKEAVKERQQLLPRGPYTTAPIDPGKPKRDRDSDAKVEQPAWGKPLNGLRLGLYQTDPNGDGTSRLNVVLENVSKEDLVLILGQSWARGKKHQLGAMGLNLTYADEMLKRPRALLSKGSKRDDLADGPVAGPFVVQLVAGGRYTISSDLHDYYDPKDVDALLAPGKYRVAAKFVGQDYLSGFKGKTDTGPRTWLDIMTYWTGTIESEHIQVTVPAKPAK
jgi:hypothetical protein